ncbi:MAG TPA: hypothetical protein VGB18_04035 [Candidatus Thermoplasmatota archaeon]
MSYKTWASQLAVPGRIGVRIQATTSPESSSHQLSACRHDGETLEVVCRCGAVIRIRCQPEETEIVGAIRYALSGVPHDSAVAASVVS